MRHRCSMQVSSKHNKTHLLKSLDAFLSPAVGFDSPPYTHIQEAGRIEESDVFLNAAWLIRKGKKHNPRK